MKKFKSFIFRYTIIISLFFCGYLILVSSGVFSQTRILFYRGLKVLILELLLAGIVGVYLYLKRKINVETYIGAVSIGASISLVFLVIFPVTVDRSISTFLLKTINVQQHRCEGGGVNKAYLEELFIVDYLVAHDAIGRRLDEQRQTGTIYEKSKGCWSVTPQGKKFISFFDVIKKYFSLSTK